MLTIRLQRAGKKNMPEFRIVLAEKAASATKKFLEVLGNYNPSKKSFNIRNEDRVKYWISEHIALSPTVHNLFVTHKLLDAKKVQAFSVPKKAAVVATAEVPAETPVAEAAPETTSVVAESAPEAAVEETPETPAPEENSAEPQA